jgi:hypothetical protein
MSVKRKSRTNCMVDSLCWMKMKRRKSTFHHNINDAISFEDLILRLRDRSRLATKSRDSSFFYHTFAVSRLASTPLPHLYKDLNEVCVDDNK